MTKRLIAAIAALTMCAAVTGCGKAAENGDSSVKTTTSAASSENSEAEESAEEESGESQGGKEEVSDESSAEDKSGNDDGDSSIGEVTVIDDPDWEEDPDYDIKLMGDNIILVDDLGQGARPTDEELAKMMDAAVTQYNAAQAQDVNAFLDSMRLDIIRAPMIEMSALAFAAVDGDEFDELLEGQEVKFEVMDDISFLLMALGDKEISEEIVTLEVGDPEEAGRLIGKLFDSVSADNITSNEDLYYTIWNDELTELGETDENTTYAAYVDRYEDHGSEMYCQLDILVMHNGYEYDMYGVDIWCVNGEYGVLIDTAYSLENEWMEGMTPQEIYEMVLGEWEE